MVLSVQNVTAGYGGGVVISDVSMQVDQGELVAIIGPNGSGKSTLIRTMSRVLRPASGTVSLDGEDIYALSPTRLARAMAVVTQETAGDIPFLSRELVMLGRLPHMKRFSGEGPADVEAVARAMELTSTMHLAERRLASLSGGERQRVVLARALAQEPRVLLLDEPTSNLDINYQVEILELVRQLALGQGLAVAMVLHDLNLAALYADRMVLLHRGRVLAAGTPRQVITSQLVERAYGASVLVTPHPAGAGRPQVSLLPRRAGCSPTA